MDFKYISTRDGKWYFFPRTFFQDFGTHYTIDYGLWKKNIPKGAINSEVEFSLWRIARWIFWITVIALAFDGLF